MRNTFRFLWILALCLCSVPQDLSALELKTHVTQYGHTSWKVRDGALNGPPEAFAQTSDGYVWVGTDSGLLRFDGLSFQQWSPMAEDEISQEGVQALFPASDGTLYIGLSLDLATWKNGSLRHLPATLRLGRISQFAEDPQHHMWFTVQRMDKNLCRLDGETVRCFGVAEGLPRSYLRLLDISSEGVFTLAAANNILHWRPGSGVISQTTIKDLTPAASYNLEFAKAANGSELVGVSVSGKGLGLEKIIGNQITPFKVGSFDGSSIAVSTIFTDRGGALWVGTTSNGLYKIAGQNVDHFDVKDGLSGDYVRSFSEDHEGNLWVTTDGGVDCFHDLKAVSWSTQEGLTAGNIGSVIASRDGSILIGIDGALNVIRNGNASVIRKAPWMADHYTTALLQDRHGRFWISLGSDLIVYDGRTFKAVKDSAGQPFGSVSSLAESADGSIWARNLRLPGSLVQIVNDKVVDTYSERGLGYALVSDGRHGVWVNSRFRFGHYTDRHMQWFPFGPAAARERFSLESALVIADDGSLYTTSNFGVWGMKSGKAQRLGARNGLPCQAATGLVFSRTHSLVIHTKCGLLEISPEDLRAWWSNPDVQVNPHLIDQLDGTDLSDATYLPEMSLASDGRVWIGNEAKVQVIDLEHTPRNLVPPPVHIEEIFADHARLAKKPTVDVPPLTRDLEIRYSGLSFAVPQKVRFRYMLDGRDTTWQEPGTRRVALYQDLKPGHYSFRVLAANNDGVWNNTGEVVQFNVRPAWFQTIWFRTLQWITVCLLIWTVYRLRVRSIAKGISARFDERLDERTRMALELHDTFLQTVQGSKMVADDALDPASDEKRMRHALERLSVWLEQAVTEGRAALHALRVSTTEKNHLAEYLERTAKEHCQRNGISVALTVIGDAKDLHPIVRDEIARIALEAIRNASLHSKASQLSMELRYASDLTLCIRDNGVGMDPELVDVGKTGHFGIQGMRDRSDRIRATIGITSTLNAGTLVLLRVPGGVVYRRENMPFHNWLSKLKGPSER